MIGLHSGRFLSDLFTPHQIMANCLTLSLRRNTKRTMQNLKVTSKTKCTLPNSHLENCGHIKVHSGLERTREAEVGKTKGTLGMRVQEAAEKLTINRVPMAFFGE